MWRQPPSRWRQTEKTTDLSSSREVDSRKKIRIIFGEIYKKLDLPPIDHHTPRVRVHVYVLMCIDTQFLQSLKCLEGMGECIMCVRVTAGLSRWCVVITQEACVGVWACVGEQIRRSFYTNLLTQASSLRTPTSIFQRSVVSIYDTRASWCAPESKNSSDLGFVRVPRSAHVRSSAIF